MRLLRQFGVLLLAVLPISACSGLADPEPAALPPDARLVSSVPVSLDTALIVSGYYSGIDTRERLVIRNAADWSDVWSRITQPAPEAPPAPAVDFTRYMVLLAATGTRFSGGYSIALDRVYSAKGTLYASVTETVPGAHCVVTGALTAPVAAVLVPRSDAEVVFIDSTAVHDCS